MKIIQLAWENFGTEDVREAWESLGNEVVLCNTSQLELLGEKGNIADRLSEVADCEKEDVIVFGFNYFPTVAKFCYERGILYCAWVYDNPCVQLYSSSLIYPTNRVFIFDSDTYLKFASSGIETVFFMPMAANPKRLQNLVEGLNAGPVSDISFVGSLYDEEHDFYKRMIDRGISQYTEGYLRGVMEAQKLLYGINIVEGRLSAPILDEMYAALPMEGEEDSVIERGTLFTDFVLNRQITAEERRAMLEAIAKSGLSVDVYTRNPSTKLAGCNVHGPVDFYEAAPKIFASSKINLNISLRSITNGIPLRCFEIMASGGFLLTNYQGDFAELGFVDGEDYVSFESVEDMLAKCEYYLSHEDERKCIAANGLAKVASAHTYVDRCREIMEIISL